MTQWLFGRPAARPAGADLITNTTHSVPNMLLSRLKVQPYDPKVLDLFMPDSIARAKGWQVFEEMQDDAQVRAVTTIKRYGPISTGWQLSAANDTPLAVKIADEIRDNFMNMDKTLEETVGQILESTFTGLSISEMLWRYETSGVYKGHFMLTDVQTRPPSVVDVNFDPTGKVIGILQSDSFGAWDTSTPGMHPFKFVVHTWQGRYGSPYGRGDGRAVYKHWWSKDFLMRAMAIYMDKYGAPSIVGRQAPNMSEAEMDDFLSLMRDIQHEGYALLPPNWDFEWVFPPGGSGNAQAYQSVIDWHDGMIAKAVLGSTLTTDQPTSGLGLGGGAVANVHADTRDLLLRKVKQDAEVVIVTRQLIKRMVRINYGREAAQTLCPKFTFAPPDLKDMGDLSKILQSLVTAQIISPNEPWIRERLQIPAHEEVHDDTAQVEVQQQEHQNNLNAIRADGDAVVQDKQLDQRLRHQDAEHAQSLKHGNSNFTQQLGQNAELNTQALGFDKAKARQASTLPLSSEFTAQQADRQAARNAQINQP
ncbi:phage portal protein family protein [Deinococcus kurensis]|uniref:phage portal protein family protein n=1 Tax=Deinococcus kurensis TaxID=2662757 RepID=UPI001391C66E|nr:DUF935 family protein [Deinococcus kurensis]